MPFRPGVVALINKGLYVDVRISLATGTGVVVIP